MKTKFFPIIIAAVALVLTACNNNPEYSSDQLNLVLNGVRYDIPLSVEEPVNLTTLCTEFDASVEIINASAFKSITVDGQKLKNGKCSLAVPEISKDKQIVIAYTAADKEGTVTLNTLHSLIPDMVVSGHGQAQGDYYCSFVWQRLVFKCDNDGKILFYRFEPRTVIETGDDSGWWDFKKHVAEDGTVYYSYHANDPQFAERLFMGYDPGMRVIMDDHYNPLDTIHLLESLNGEVAEGEPLDGHDFYFFSPNHYIVSAYIRRTRHNQAIFACYLQEVENGQVVFDWWSVDHPETVEWTDPVFGLERDYMHFNCVQVLPDGELLCSLRHESTIVKIKRSDKSGDILWAIHGYDQPEEYSFCGQHYATLHGNTLTLFDNGNGHTPPATRLLKLQINPENGVVLSGENILPANDRVYFTTACGSFVPVGDYYVAGWGIPGLEAGPNDRLVTEYDAAGNEIFGIRHTGGYQENFFNGSYRCVKCQ